MVGTSRELRNHLHEDVRTKSLAHMETHAIRTMSRQGPTPTTEGPLSTTMTRMSTKTVKSQDGLNEDTALHVTLEPIEALNDEDLVSGLT